MHIILAFVAGWLLKLAVVDGELSSAILFLFVFMIGLGTMPTVPTEENEEEE